MAREEAMHEADLADEKDAERETPAPCDDSERPTNALEASRHDESRDRERARDEQHPGDRPEPEHAQPASSSRSTDRSDFAQRA